jgi:SapB morphogen precursor RamS
MAILDLQSMGTPEASYSDAISTLSFGGCHALSTFSVAVCG